MTDANKKVPHTFQCREALWQKFEQMARELECSVDYLINDAMKQYARQRGYATATASAAASPSIVPPPPPPLAGAVPPPPPPPPVEKRCCGTASSCSRHRCRPWNRATLRRHLPTRSLTTAPPLPGSNR